VISVIVAIVSDTTEPRADVRHLSGCLEALARQADAPPMEVIVPHHRNVEGIDELERRFPQVVFLPLTGTDVSSKGGSREHHDVLRARGIAVARGDLIALLEDHARPDERWCASIVAAHRSAYAAIGGAIENGIDRPLNWAVYYCDFGKYQNPVPSGESGFASDANTSYKRTALESVRALWEQSFREVVVNGALISRGEKIALRSEIVVYQHRDRLQLGTALRERYIWGRSYAVTRCQLLRNSNRLFYAALSPVLPVIMMLRLAQTAWQRRRRFGRFVGALHFIAILLASWSFGEAMGYLTRALPRAPSAS
jgi:hypothetical protein